jgi:hypothetical protein
VRPLRRQLPHLSTIWRVLVLARVPSCRSRASACTSRCCTCVERKKRHYVYFFFFFFYYLFFFSLSLSSHLSSGKHLMRSFFLLPLVPGFDPSGLPLISVVTEPREPKDLPLFHLPWSSSFFFAITDLTRYLFSWFRFLQ